MPEVKQKVDVYQVEYLCDECKVGVLRFIGQQKEGIIKGSVILTHSCTNCKKIKMINNKTYPFQMLQPIEGNIITDGKE